MNNDRKRIQLSFRAFGRSHDAWLKKAAFVRSPGQPHAIQRILDNVISFVIQINHTTKIVNSLENERGSSYIKRRG